MILITPSPQIYMAVILVTLKGKNSDFLQVTVQGLKLPLHLRNLRGPRACDINGKKFSSPERTIMKQEGLVCTDANDMTSQTATPYYLLVLSVTYCSVGPVGLQWGEPAMESNDCHLDNAAGTWGL